MSPGNFALNPGEAETVKVPWVLQGAMVFSLMGGMVQASLLHASKDVLWRLETAMVGNFEGIQRLHFLIFFVLFSKAGSGCKDDDR